MGESTHQARFLDLAKRMASYQERYESQRDKRALFAFTYGIISRILAEKIGEPGGFDDPEWICRLAEQSARHYLHSMDSLDQGAGPTAADSELPGPGPWAEVHRLMKKGSSVLEDFTYSTSAHIFWDLPHALVAAESEASHIRDYQRVSEILARATDPIQRAVAERYNPALRWFDRLNGRTDEEWGRRLVRDQRALAWYEAARLAASETRSQARQDLADRLHELMHSPRSFLLLRLTRPLVRPFQRWPA